MSFHRWLQNLNSALAPGRGHLRRPRRPATHRPRLEVLEDRTVPSGYQQINLTSDQAGVRLFTDSNLNGWGMTSLPNGSFVVANTFSTGLATFFSSSGRVLPMTITVPVEAQESAYLSAALKVDISTQYGHPTGVVYNPTKAFVITNLVTHVSAPATLIFDSIDGTISGWNPIVDPTHAILIRDTWAEAQASVVTSAGYAVKPAVYTGLEIGQDSQGNPVLYAADFLNNQLEVIDGRFNDIGKPISTAGLGVSSDPYSWVWSVQAVNDKLYVTFADLLNPTGGGGGAVDVFDTNGHFQYQLDANGPGPGRLQNPWGITQAPANFGVYSNDLLVGNVAGAGNINVYNPTTHAYLGLLRQPDGTPIAIKGLWDLEFGDGTPKGGKTNQLFFDAGPNRPGDSTGGLFGVIQPAGHRGRHHGGDRVCEVAALGHGCGVLLGGLQVQLATSPSPVPAAGAPSASAGGSNQAVPTVSTLADRVLGVSAHRVRDQVFADLEDTQSAALAPTVDPPWIW
jgi:uncharacterized protein (TIGR03118 family)